MTNLIQKAKQFATRAHKGQVRKDGVTPYINHPEAVYNLLLCAGITNEDMLCAAWLHDVVEDCGVKLDEIEREFNSNIRSLVDSLSEKDCKIKYRDDIEKSSNQVKMIKLADTIHNTSGIYNDFISEKTRTRKIIDSIEVYLPMAKKIHEPFYHMLKYHVDKREDFWAKQSLKD